ncbi:MAG: class I SAM-dependent rRNA methyltransferase [Myxococcaceae bacterium]|nr:class I SAM-dependent rRNA methyltransferase [Myxococcaceae bacterium]
MSALVRLEVKEGVGRHLKAGHPWVFRKALDQVPKLPKGAIIDLVEDGRFLARGYFDPLSSIAVRVLTRDHTRTIDQRFFDEVVRECWERRQSMLDLSDTDAYRLIHGEGDGLPGVVVDLYAGWAVLKLYSAGLTPARAMIVEALKSQVPGLKGVVGRDEVPRDDEPEEGRGQGRMLFGPEAPRPIAIRERGARFLVDVYEGQKTGFFLDQRENRYLVRRLGRGREVLNCFSFSGGFSVNAALGGATKVLSVDQDEDAIALARENFEANGLEPAKHDFMAADVFKVLGSLAKQGQKFDLVLLDPPAFAKSQKAVEAAIDGYASLNRQALELVRPGGLLVTASCSARVTHEQFLNAVKEAGFKAQVDLTLVEDRFQPADHPLRLQFPEGRYLKFLVLQTGR